MGNHINQIDQNSIKEKPTFKIIRCGMHAEGSLITTQMNLFRSIFFSLHSMHLVIQHTTINCDGVKVNLWRIFYVFLQSERQNIDSLDLDMYIWEMYTSLVLK